MGYSLILKYFVSLLIYGISSSFGNSKVNGKVEFVVKTVKNFLCKVFSSGRDLYMVIFDYRNMLT